MADFESLVSAIGMLEAMTQNKQEKMKTNQERMKAKLETNQENMKAKTDINNEKFEVLRGVPASRMDIHQDRTVH
jgi:hypothetical protein